jgi:hypothetical protein
LRLLIESVETHLSESRVRTELADTTHARLVALRERIAEVEGDDTPEAFSTRQKVVRLLVAGVTIEKAHRGDALRVCVTYRFDPPPGEAEAGEGGQGNVFAGDVRNPSGNLAAKRKPRGASSRHRSTVVLLGVP